MEIVLAFTLGFIGGAMLGIWLASFMYRKVKKTRFSLSKQDFEKLVQGKELETGLHKVILKKIGFEAIREAVDYAEEKSFTPRAYYPEETKTE